MQSNLKNAVDLIQMLPEEEQSEFVQDIVEKAEKRVLMKQLREAEARGGEFTHDEVWAEVEAKLKAHGV